ncbi:MAG: twin-arginine translocase TatA/TatE family subunit [Vicinamibacterales bacterium]
MGIFGMGGMEIMVIMLVALIIFGPGKLPEIGAQVGRAVRDFRRATTDLQREFTDSTSDIRSTMDEMKGTMAQVERETKDLAQSIPATIEGAGSAATTGAGTNGATPRAVAPSRSDPLADFDSLDDEVFSGSKPSPPAD